MRPRWARPVAWGVWAVTSAAASAGLALMPVTGFRTVEEPVFVTAILSMSTLGAVVAVRQPTNRVAWLLLACAFGGSLTSVGPQLGIYAVEVSSLGRGVGLVGLHLNGIGILGFLGGLSVLGLTAPDGRLPTGRWRYGVWMPAALAVLGIVVTAVGWTRPADVSAAIRTDQVFDLENAAGVDKVFAVAEAVVGVLIVLSVCVGIAGLLASLRRAKGEERDQLKWIVSGVAVALGIPFATLTQPPGAVAGFGPLIPGLATLAVSAGFALALFRHRLWNIDLVINRTLVYAVLTVGIAGVYVAVVWALGGVLGARGGFEVSLVGAALVALVVNPARLRVQRLVNRAMFGDRDDPYRVLRRLQDSIERTLTPSEALRVAVDDLADALRLRFVAVDAADEDGVERLACRGVAVEEPVVVPLRHHGVEVGQLLAARLAGEALTPADRAVLADVAGQLAATVFAARLTDDLLQSRQRLVTAREEERRRLRRDLHDGLGPTLAAFTLQLDTARNLVRRDPARAEELLEQLRAQAGAATDDIRRVAYDLRPPALDELGLVGALHEQALRLGAGDGQTCFDVEADHLVATLPAATEVAAYRIACEAMTNVARHAHATRCYVRLTGDVALNIDVVDDGRGLPDSATAGVGLRSIAERARELGGQVAVHPVVGGGTRVTAHLPLAAPMRTLG